MQQRLLVKFSCNSHNNIPTERFTCYIPIGFCIQQLLLSGNPCNFHTLSLNNHASLLTNVLSIILNNLFQITRIIFFPATNNNFVIKVYHQIYPQFLWNFTQLQLSHQHLYPILHPLTHITPFHIFSYIFCYPQLLIVSYYQLYCFLLSFMSSYQYIMVQPDYLYP